MGRFVGDERREIVTDLASLYDEVLDSSQPRIACLVAEGGWGKTRIVQEFYGWLQRERQPQGAYWPPELVEAKQDPMRSRKVIYPERIEAPADLPMPWLWWGLRCEEVSSGRKLPALLTDGRQLKAHLDGLIAAAERSHENRDLALSVLGEAMAFIPGVGQIASIALTTQELAPLAWKKFVRAFKKGQDRRRLEQEPRTVDVATAGTPELNALVELVKQFVSPELPLVLAVDDAHTADPDTIEFVRRILALEAPILVICTAWPSVLDDQLDDEEAIEPSMRATFGGLLGALQSELPEVVRRYDLSPMPDEALTELIVSVAPNTKEESREALVEVSGGNPLVLRLNLTSSRVQRSIVDGAITLSPENLKKLPRGYERLISERFEELEEDDQMWLAEAVLQGFEFLPDYFSSPEEDLDHERLGAFVRVPWEGPHRVGRFIEPAVHRAIQHEAEGLLSDEEREAFDRSTLVALQERPMSSPGQEEGGGVWCKLLLRLAEASPDPELPDPEIVAEAAHRLSFIDRDLGLHREELSAAEAAVRWMKDDTDLATKALRITRWAAALRANNEPEEAVRKAKEALALLDSEEHPDTSDLVEVMYVLSQAYLQDQNPEAARDVAARAREVADNVSDKISALEVVAEAQEALGDLEGGRAAFTEAIEIARENDPSNTATVLQLEISRALIDDRYGVAEHWEELTERVEEELGKDEGSYEFCLTQVVYQLLFAGELDRADAALTKLRALPGFQQNHVIEAMQDLLAGGDMSTFREAFDELVSAPYNSRNETALFAEMNSIFGAPSPEGPPLSGPFDFLRRVSINLDDALAWMLEQFREGSEEWNSLERLFAVQGGAVQLGERLLKVGQPSPVSGELLAEIQRVVREHDSLPALARQLLGCYADAIAVLEKGAVEPLDEDLSPLLQVRTRAQCAVAAYAKGDDALATSLLEDAYARMEKLGSWPSRRLVLAATERCGSPLCARTWMTVPKLDFGAEAERWEAFTLLGIWLYRCGRYAEAEPFERQVLEERSRANGEKDMGTLTAKSSLASTLLKLRELEEARDLFREVAEGRVDLFGEDHELTLSAKRNLVSALMDMQDFQAAKPVQEEIVAAGSESDPSLLPDQELLATIHGNLGEHETARPLWEAAFKRRTEEIGEEHEVTLGVMLALGECLHQCEESDGKRELAERLVEHLLVTAGPDGPATRKAKLLLASICIEEKELEEAARLTREVVDSRTQTLGTSNSLTVEAKANLGVTLFNQGRFEEASELEGEVLNLREQEVHQARANAAVSARTLAQTLAKIDGRLDQAVAMIQTVVDELRVLAGEEHPATAYAVDRLVELRLQAEEPEKAREAALQSLEALRAKLDGDDPRVMAAEARLKAVEEEQVET